jgi:hypothetical protein
MRDGQRHLWEIDHPYYCAEGNYFSNGMHFEHESWADFIAEVGELDEDMNAVFRWDWHRADPSDYEDEPLPGDTLQVHWVGQRKASFWSTECPVTEADEPAVREWLTRRAAHMRKLWEPFL